MTDNPELMVDLLHQSDRWVDARGREHRIEDMPVPYIRRVVAFLEERAGEVQWADSVREALKMDGAPDDAVEDWVQRDRDRMNDPVGWLRTTPLMTRFLAVLARAEEGA